VSGCRIEDIKVGDLDQAPMASSSSRNLSVVQSHYVNGGLYSHQLRQSHLVQETFHIFVELSQNSQIIYISPGLGAGTRDPGKVLK
jgi:hypothetical protein